MSEHDPRDDPDDGGYGIPPEPRRVIWTMDWGDGRKTQEFEAERAMAALLMAEAVFLNGAWWDNAPERINVSVCCNDVFAWGCADAEDLPWSEVQNLYETHVKDPVWGAAVWCIKRRGEMPQRPVARRIREAGIWNLDAMGLAANGYDTACAKWAEERREPERGWENEGGALTPEPAP